MSVFAQYVLVFPAEVEERSRDKINIALAVGK